MLSVSAGDVASVLKSCIFLHICCLYVRVSGSREELYPPVTAGVRETVFKVAFFLVNVKRKLYLCQAGGGEQAAEGAVLLPLWGALC